MPDKEKQSKFSMSSIFSMEKSLEKVQDITLSAISDDQLMSLDNQLCFSLYVCSKEVIRKYKPLLEPYDLTYTGYITLMALWDKDGVNVKELGKRLYLDSGTLTPLLKKLESQGYVTRERDPKDERNIIIKLTDKGRDIKTEAVCVPKELMSEVGFGNVKSYLLTQTLHQLMEALTEESDNTEKSDSEKAEKRLEKKSDKKAEKKK